MRYATPEAFRAALEDRLKHAQNARKPPGGRRERVGVGGVCLLPARLPTPAENRSRLGLDHGRDHAGVGLGGARGRWGWLRRHRDHVSASCSPQRRTSTMIATEASVNTRPSSSTWGSLVAAILSHVLASRP